MNVEVKKSRIEGLGIFALVPFAKGQCIRKIKVIREITDDAPMREDLGERKDYCDYPDGKVVLLGYPDRHINHSCDPNAYVLYDEDGCYFYAIRDISAGEEITCDYNINITSGTSWPCNCGAERCRGETIGDYFKLPIDIQREYRSFLASWFIQRYHEALKSLDENSDKNSFT